MPMRRRCGARWLPEEPFSEYQQNRNAREARGGVPWASVTAMTPTPEFRALARASLRLSRPAADVELESRWDALATLALVRRYAHIIQRGRARWTVRISAAGRSAASVERDLASVAEWASGHPHEHVRIVAGDRAVDLS